MEPSKSGAEAMEDTSICIDWQTDTERMICVASDIGKLKRPNSDWCPASFTMKKPLYKGKASLLYVATDHHTSEDVVLKLYRKSKLNTLNRYQVEREIRIHIRLKHEYIIALYAAFEDSKYVYMVLEYAQEGDLFGVMKKNGQYKEGQAVKEVLHPFLNVLLYLHSMDIIHRDIKPENIVVSEANTIKVADFGLSIDTTKERPVTRAGTLDYMAPEVLVCPDKKFPDQNKDNLSIAYSRQVDTWAVGILAYELIVGSPPFEKESRAATYDEIMYKEPVFPSVMTDACKDFIQTALTKNSAERPGIIKLMKHPWIALYQRPCSYRNLHASSNLVDACSVPSDSSLSTAEHCDPSSIQGAPICAANRTLLETKDKHEVGTNACHKSQSNEKLSRTFQDGVTAGQDSVVVDGDGPVVAGIRAADTISSLCAEGRDGLEPPKGILSKTVVTIHSPISKGGVVPVVSAACIPRNNHALPLLSSTTGSVISGVQQMEDEERLGTNEKERKVCIGGHQLHHISPHRASYSNHNTQHDSKDDRDDQNTSKSSQKDKRSTGGRVLGVFGFKQASKKDFDVETVAPRVCSMSALASFSSASHQAHTTKARRCPDDEEDAEAVEFSEDASLDLEPSPPSWTPLSHPSLRPAHRLNREITASHLSFSSTRSSLIAECKGRCTEKPSSSALECISQGTMERCGDEASQRLASIMKSPSMKRGLAPMSASAYEKCNLISGDE